ncbi:biopolymer transporter TolR [Flaviramulus sp. BrNp1-15]|uniref:TolB family protein n=1 Tax=Flaviramulus sp. BrNp1-15 TaxID=2916754 RepID=UPI001EE8A263|nr:biopolymer transporter TolR [Flaviramulus sp. BrNp1-15]ULC60853.1 biopolymer transporter TolR [Flaviramulus sp. BrNp1-15]
MKKLLAICLIFTFSNSHILTSQTTMNQSAKFGVFENQTNVGNPKHKGSIVYNPETQEYTITGSGMNIWGGTDQFQYLYKSIQGDFIVRAHMKFTSEGVDPHRKMGWMVRNNLSSNSPEVHASIHGGDGLTALQYRKTDGGETEQIVESLDKLPDVVQLERRGNDYYMSTAHYGEPFVTTKLENVPLRNEAFVGLYVCSHNEDVIETAVFSNVRIIKPADPDFQPYRDYIGSYMETMNVETGLRKTLFYSAHSIQAPNWVNNDKELVYNSNGFLYRYSFENGESQQINTGFAIDNNNDHIFSFDETLLGISHHNSDDNRTSSIYIMNPKGDSIPRKITHDGVGASYLHGISPDNKTIIYTANRKGKYDIYGSDIETREEFQLTDTKDLDDGSEYSPDGKYIYFNSNRTGNMQLWRMDADGKNPKQLTFDENFKDWFPHISPDGKWIVFISFPPTIAFGDHPFYQHCTLRLMPTDLSTKPKIIAYLYGGQGTMNVPSWSKDSKHIAFVTNTD